MKEVLVSDIMTHNPITIKPSTNLLECAKIMVRKRIGSLIIADEQKILRGFISRRDILWALIKKSKEDLGKIRAIDISPRKIAIIKPSSTMKDAISKMKLVGFERLPVIDRGEVVGIITIKDILSFHPEIYPELGEIAKVKDEGEKLKRLKERDVSREEGSCERCGRQSSLQRFNGMVLCDECMDSV